MPQYFEQPQCPACSKLFKTHQGVNAHLSASRSCSWWRKGKIRELDNSLPYDNSSESPDNSMDLDSQLLDNNPNNHNPEDGNGDGNGDGDEVYLSDLDLDNDSFHFIPSQPILDLDNEGGPGPSTASNQIRRMLDDDEDLRVIDEDKSAGKVLRKVQQAVDPDGDVNMESGNEEAQKYTPFTSELDWKVAQWAIKDGPGHKAFDRLLTIPGVSRFIWKLGHNPF